MLIPHTLRPVIGTAILASLFLPGRLAAQDKVQPYALSTIATFKGFADGGNPRGQLILGSDGRTLYGTTQAGGNYGYGTVFSLDTATGALSTLATFTGPNGARPTAGLTQGPDGTLYGTTIEGGNGGGANGYGTAFSLNPATRSLTTLAVFNSANGSVPVGGLTLIGSSLYGTTYTGGANNYGTVFSIPTSGGGPTTIANFDRFSPGGFYPQSGLTPSSDGTTLYGTATSGGQNGSGAVFSVPVTGGALKGVFSFSNTDANGNYPLSGMILGPSGKTLYGTTFDGPGIGGNGTVFSLDVSTGTLTTLAALSGSNGANPYAGLTLSADGKTLLGAASSGGTTNGTVFSLPIGGGTVTPLITFTGANGADPRASLTPGPDGTFYGTTYGSNLVGGAGGYGTVFLLTPTPEPSQTAALGLGMLGLAGLALKARRSLRA